MKVRVKRCLLERAKKHSRLEKDLALNLVDLLIPKDDQPNYNRTGTNNKLPFPKDFLQAIKGKLLKILMFLITG